MLTTGQIVEVEVTNVQVFGVFCRHQDETLLVRIPELSWIGSFNSSQQFAAPRDRLTVKILHVDQLRGEIWASVRAVHPDPWETGQLEPGTLHVARVVRHVESADRCGGQPAYLVEVLPGAFAMLCSDGLQLAVGQRIAVVVNEVDVSRGAVRLAAAPWFHSSPD